MFNAFFFLLPQSLILLVDLGLPDPLQLEAHECRISDFPFVDTEIVRDQLYQLNVCKSMWSNGIHHTAVEELVDVMAGYLSLNCLPRVCGV